MVKWSDSPLIKIKSCYRKRYLTIGHKNNLLDSYSNTIHYLATDAKQMEKSPERRQL